MVPVERQQRKAFPMNYLEKMRFRWEQKESDNYRESGFTTKQSPTARFSTSLDFNSRATILDEAARMQDQKVRLVTASVEEIEKVDNMYIDSIKTKL